LHPDGERVAGQVFDPASQAELKTGRFIFNVFEKLKSLETRR
jgi:hypothetical protein